MQIRQLILEIFKKVFNKIAASMQVVNDKVIIQNDGKEIPVKSIEPAKILTPSVVDSCSSSVEVFGKTHVGFDKNLILPDSFAVYDPLFSVQQFLEGRGSFLAKYVYNKMLASKLIDSSCYAANFSQKWILVRLQCEQGAISSSAQPIDPILNRILGFGATDEKSGDIVKYHGFEKQIQEAAKFSREKFNMGGNFIGKVMKVDEERGGVFATVKPQNKFTYLVYIYTPWVGNEKRITKNGVKLGYDNSPYGALLTWLVWKQFFPKDFENINKNIV